MDGENMPPVSPGMLEYYRQRWAGPVPPAGPDVAKPVDPQPCLICREEKPPALYMGAKSKFAGRPVCMDCLLFVLESAAEYVAQGMPNPKVGRRHHGRAAAA